MYKIVSDIPLPSGVYKFPFDELEVGDSFLVEEKEIESLRSTVSSWTNTNKPKRLSCRSVEGGMRVWRIK